MAQTKAELKKLNREEQEAILKELEVEFTSNDKEDDIITKIIEAQKLAEAEAIAEASKNKTKKIKVDVIAAGKSLTTKKGVKSDGDIIEASMFAGGKKVFDDLKTKKFIIEVEREVKA